MERCIYLQESTPSCKGFEWRVLKVGNTNETLRKPRIVSIFSGCGGLDYGFHMEGYETIWANDFAEWACKSFAANFGDVIHYKDITKIDP